MTTAKVKGLLAQLRDAANAIKAQIHEADAQIAALTEQRRALTDAPVSKDDLAEFVRADIQRRANNYQWRIDKWAREGGFPVSFAALERNHVAGKPQPLPYWDGVPHHDALNIELHGMYHLFGDLLAERFLTALDTLGYADSLVPVADRRRQIAEIDAKLKELNAKRDELANDLISSGMYE
ncbi:MAG: hypothetical protein Q8J80_09820 [Gallionella sp.]|nr:hypothetical protein [Gallionella sp.]